MTAEVKKMTKADMMETTGPMITIPVKACWVHKAIMMCGKTENSVHKIPGVRMGWTAQGAFLLEAKSQKDGSIERHLLPSAAISDSILE